MGNRVGVEYRRRIRAGSRAVYTAVGGVHPSHHLSMWSSLDSSAGPGGGVVVETRPGVEGRWALGARGGVREPRRGESGEGAPLLLLLLHNGGAATIGAAWPVGRGGGGGGRVRGGCVCVFSATMLMQCLCGRRRGTVEMMQPCQLYLHVISLVGLVWWPSTCTRPINRLAWAVGLKCIIDHQHTDVLHAAVCRN